MPLASGPLARVAASVTALTLPWRSRRVRSGQRAAGWLALPILAVLAGCANTDPYAFPPVCPQFGTLPDAADVTRFRGPGTDRTDMAIDARITAPRGKCSRDADGRLKVDTYVRLLVTRGPAAPGRTESVDYFIAVVEGQGHILAKYPLRAQVEFPPNVDRLELTGETVTLSLPTKTGRAGDAFTLLSGFQLTPAELAFNRQHAAR
jgi:hypothetical protein